MAMPENWTGTDTAWVAFCAIVSIGAVLGVGYVVWHTLPYLLAAAAGVGAAALYVTLRNTRAPNI